MQTNGQNSGASDGISVYEIRNHLKGLSDEDVVRAYLAGNEFAFNEIVRRYENFLHRFIFRMLGDWDLAQESVQRVFIKVSTHASSFSFEGKFSTWIFQIAKNRALTESRLACGLMRTSTWSVGELEEVDGFQLKDLKNGPEEVLLQKEQRRLIENALLELSPLYRDIIRMHYLDGMSYQELVCATGLKYGVVRTRLYRGRAKLRIIVGSSLD